MGKRRRGRKQGGKRWVRLLLLSFALALLAIWGLIRLSATRRGWTSLRSPAEVVTPAQHAGDEIAPHERRRLEDILKHRQQR